jgi:hypothetical protein
LSYWLGARDYLQGMLGKFPRYTCHVRWLPCKDIPILTEELDERAFLFGGQICPNGGGLGVIASDKFHLFCINCRLKGGRGGRNLLLGCRHLRGVRVGMDFFELLAEEHCFRESGFSFLALLCLSEAAINGDYAIRSWHLQLIVDVTWPRMEAVESGAPEDHVVCTFERDHLKGYRLFSVIFITTKGNLECDRTEGLSLAARNHSIKSDSTVAELGLGKAKFCQSFHVHDVQAAAAIH